MYQTIATMDNEDQAEQLVNKEIDYVHKQKTAPAGGYRRLRMHTLARGKNEYKIYFKLSRTNQFSKCGGYCQCRYNMIKGTRHCYYHQENPQDCCSGLQLVLKKEVKKTKQRKNMRSLKTYNYEAKAFKE